MNAGTWLGLVAALLLASIVPRVGESSEVLYRELPVLRPLSGDQLAWIAPRMNLNGLPMSMQSLTSARPLADTVERYRQRWSAKNDVRILQRGPWQILVTRHGQHARSLHLRESAHGTEGIYVVSPDPTRETPSLLTSIPLPPSLTVLQRTSFSDAGREAESVVLRGAFDVAGEARALRALVRARGWQMQVDEPARQHPNGHVLSFSNGSHVIQAFIANDARWDGHTLVLLTSMPL